MARIAERNGKSEAARKAYLQILDQDPEHMESLHRMAVTSVKANSLEEAFDYFERAASLAEPSGELLCDYGYALYLYEDFEAAESILQRARDLQPDNLRVANNLALVLGRQGEYDEAYALFQLSNNRAEALANLAYVQSQAGDISFAKENYHLALGIDPTLSVAANGLCELHTAFPDDDSILIRPFRGSADSPEVQMASQSNSSNDVDRLIRTIAFQPNTGTTSPQQRRFIQPAEQPSIEKHGSRSNQRQRVR